MFDGTRTFGTVAFVVLGGAILTSSVGGSTGIIGALIGLYFVKQFCNGLTARDRRGRGGTRNRRRRRR